MRAIWDSWQNGTKLDFRGDFYQHTLMTPFFNPGADRSGSAGGVPGRGRGENDRGGRRGGRWHARPPFTTERYLREVTLPAHRGRAWRRSGASRLGLPAVLPGLRGHRQHRGGHGHGDDRRPSPDRLLRLDAGLPAGARPARLGRPADRAQRACPSRASGRRWAS